MTSPTVPVTADSAQSILGGFRLAITALEEGLAALRNNWTRALASIQETLGRLRHHLSTDGIADSVVEWFTEEIASCIATCERLVATINVKVTELLARAEHGVHGSIPVLSLLETALAYNSKVLAPFTDIGTEMEAKGDIVYWQGPTRDAYDKRVAEQVDAASATTERITMMSGWLVDVGTANMDYIAKLGSKVADVVGALVTALVEGGATTAGVVSQLPLALQDFAEVIGEATAAALEYLFDLGTYLTSIVGLINDGDKSTKDSSELGEHVTWPTIAG